MFTTTILSFAHDDPDVTILHGYQKENGVHIQLFDYKDGSKSRVLVTDGTKIICEFEIP